MKIQLIKYFALMLFGLFFLACNKPSPSVLDLNIEIVRPRALRCGTEVNTRNVCIADIAYVFATSAKMLVMYRYDELNQKEETLLVCPSSDSRCLPFLGGFIVRFQFMGYGRTWIVATTLKVELDSPDLFCLDRNGQCKRVEFYVRL